MALALGFFMGGLNVAAHLWKGPGLFGVCRKSVEAEFLFKPKLFDSHV
mgnify:CR=1 FL=1